jgi:SET domain-containing protein
MLLIKTITRVSEIHGIGLFAAEYIPQGTMTWSFLEGFDLRLPRSILSELSAPAREQFQKYSYFDSGSMLYELCSDDARFFNHSDTPNTGSLSDVIDIALSDIQPGDELTCDYRTFDAEWQLKLKDRKSP